MTNKLTPEEIKKALECCTPENESCLNCPLIDVSVPECAGILYKATIDLINRQQAEIDEARIGVKSYKGKYESAVETSRELKLVIAEQQTEIEKLKYNCGCRLKNVKSTQAEAIKKFTEKLKEKKHVVLSPNGYPIDENDWVIYEEDIDETYKEMVGDDK